MNTIPRIIAILSFLVLTGCTTFNVSHDYAPSYAFQNIQTYYWSGDPESQLKDLTEQRIRQTCQTVLQDKGLTPAGKDEADVWIQARYIVEKEYEVSTFDYWHRGYFYPYHYGLNSDLVTQVREYETGTIVIDIIDAKNNEIVWRGIAERRLDNSLTPEERQKRINKAVSMIFSEFPPDQR